MSQILLFVRNSYKGHQHKQYLNTMSKSLKNIFLLLIGITIFIIFILEIGSPKHLNMIFNFGWLNTFIVTLLTFIIILIAAFRWYLLINLQKNSVVSFNPILKASVWARLSSQTTSQIFGDVGMKMLMAKNINVSFPEIIFSVIWDKSFELLMLISATIGYITITHIFNMEILQWLFIPFCFLLLFPLSMLSIFITQLFLKTKKKMNNNFKPRFSISNAASISILSLMKYILVSFRYYIIIAYFNFQIKFFDVFLGTALTQLGNIVAVTPGGLGFIETGWIGFFKYLNIQDEYLGAFLLTQRMIILLSVFIVFAIFNGYYFITNYNKLKHHQAKEAE
ncbi:flippase-like domain-containing protein [candidate division KSB1 bacterium]|nr:flippase-like domain-containing protein [candidate division KSB1 bacterium]